jgi:hemerythrin-like domain-containing protein
MKISSSGISNTVKRTVRGNMGDYKGETMRTDLEMEHPDLLEAAYATCRNECDALQNELSKLVEDAEDSAETRERYMQLLKQIRLAAEKQFAIGRAQRDPSRSGQA